MRVEPHRSAVGIDVETILRQSGQVRPCELAAQGEYQSVVAKGLRPLGIVVGHGPRGDVDARHLALDAAHADGHQHLVERHARLRKVGLVVPHTDRMPRRIVQQHDLDLPCAEHLARSRGRKCAPEAGETAAENKDASG